MCDEYEDERMRAFWRALATIRANEQTADMPEPQDVPPIPVVKELGDASKPRPRTLVR